MTYLHFLPVTKPTDLQMTSASLLDHPVSHIVPILPSISMLTLPWLSPPSLILTLKPV